MKNIKTIVIYLLFIVIGTLHVYLFVSGISLGDEITKYEAGTKKLQQENIDLEKKLYSIESLANAASAAATLNFTKKAVPIYLDTAGIAMNP